MKELLKFLEILKKEQQTLEDLENDKIDGEIVVFFKIREDQNVRNSVKIDINKHLNLFKGAIKKEILKEIQISKEKINELKKQYDKDIELMNKISSELENYKG